MTVLGKSLAFVNLVLSLFVGGLLVVNYVARTNWHAAYDEAAKQIQVANANRQKAESELASVQGKLAEANATMAANKTKVEAKDQEWTARLKAETEKLERQLAAANTSNVAATATTGELERLSREVDQLKALTAQRDVQLRDMEKKVEDHRSARVEAEIASRSQQERNENLLKENERLVKENTQLKASGGGAALAMQTTSQKNPPHEDVEGLIQKIDPPSGLVTIDIGSDAGITKGNTLEVFRLKPEPKYLGTIQVLAVQPDKAVGKPLNRTMGQIQVGDRVAANILNKR
jgi:chromosome segregation ATPase